MSLIRLSQLSIAACLLGLVALLSVIVVSQGRVHENHRQIETLQRLDERLHQFSLLGQELLGSSMTARGPRTAGTESQLREFRHLTAVLQAQLMEVADSYPAARNLASEVRGIAASIAGAGGVDPFGAEAGQQRSSMDAQTANLALQSRILTVDGSIDGILAAAGQRDVFDTERLANGFAIAAIAFGVSCLWAFSLIYRRITGPAIEISKMVDRLQAGEAEARVPVSTGDEMGRLARKLNTLAQERQQADALVAAQRSELRYQARMLEASQRVARVGSWRVHLSEERAEWSRETYRIFGVSPAEFTPNPANFLAAIHPDDAEAVREERARALSLQVPYDMRARIVRPDGAVRHVHLRAEVELGDDGTPCMLEGVVQDITDLQQAEAAVREHSYLLEVAGRLARIGGWAVDVRTGEVAWSDVVAEIHGQPSGYAPTIDEGLDFYAPADRPRIREALTACAEQGVAFDEELRIVTAPDEHTWVRVVGEAEFDGHGGVRRVHGAFQDITEQKDAEQERFRLTKRLADVLGSITDAFFVLDREWRFEYLNHEAERLLRRPRSELIGRNVWDEFPEAVGTEIERQYRRAMSEQKTIGLESYYGPLECWFGIRAYPSREGLTVYFRDITKHRQLVEQLERHEREITESRDRLAASLRTRGAIINALPAQIAMLDREGIILEVNEGWHESGPECTDGDEIHGVGSHYLEVLERVVGRDRDGIAEIASELRAVLAGTAESFSTEYRSDFGDEERWFRVLANSLAEDGDCAARPGAVVMHLDITESKRAERVLDRLAYEDALTGQYSRHGFIRELRRIVAQKGWQPLSIVAMLDIERQRDINEAHGYDAGDSLLRGVGARLKQHAGTGAIVARTGNDEFAVYLPERFDQSASQLRSDLQKAFDEPFHVGQLTVKVGARFGFSQFGSQGRRIETLLREAEVALNHSTLPQTATSATDYTVSLGVKARSRVEITHGLRRALEEDQFRLHFQPKVDLRTGEILQGEALIRWKHPNRGLLPPAAFIPIAEQSQLIAPIGRWTINETCRHLRQWIDQGLSVVPVAVNVSLVQFIHDAPFSTVVDALQKYGLPSSLLRLEITESVFHRETDELHATLWNLRRAGVGLALDDFGTGYSSLLYLQRYPFDEIKVDRGFVAKILDNPYSREIVLSVLRMADALGARAVAEGIESQAVAEELLRLGCVAGQGFYYSRPMDESDFRQLLRTGARLPDALASSA